jgi:hypothetical protein
MPELTFMRVPTKLLLSQRMKNQRLEFAKESQLEMNRIRRLSALCEKHWREPVEMQLMTPEKMYLLEELFTEPHIQEKVYDAEFIGWGVYCTYTFLILTICSTFKKKLFLRNKAKFFCANFAAQFSCD